VCSGLVGWGAARGARIYRVAACGCWAGGQAEEAGEEGKMKQASGWGCPRGEKKKDREDAGGAVVVGEGAWVRSRFGQPRVQGRGG
jgi:hypothetical protein